MLQSYVLEAHKPHSLESLAFRHLGRTGAHLRGRLRQGRATRSRSRRSSSSARPSTRARTATWRCTCTEALWPQIEAEPGLARRLPAHRDAGLRGARPHRAQRRADRQRAARRAEPGARRAHGRARAARPTSSPGQPFNLGSPKQIGEILFGKLGLPVKRKTASGAPSTDEDVLQELAADYPLPARLLEHRSLSKLKGTYTDKLPLMVNPATGRVHTTYAQAVAVTGRLSSNDPNLQNIPIRTRRGPARPRGLHRPAGARDPLGRLLADRAAHHGAHLRATPACCAPSATASTSTARPRPRSSAPPLDEVTSEQRRYAKVINFGLIYGMSAFGLAANLGIERSAATAYIERYFARYPGVKRYMDETRASALRAAATSRRCSAGASTCPRSRSRGRAGGGRAPGDQRADAGHRRRPDQAGDDRGAARARRARRARRG